MKNTIKELILFLEKNEYEVLNIKIYNNHTQFKLYNSKNKWCIVNAAHKSDVKSMVFDIIQNFKHKGEIYI